MVQLASNLISTPVIIGLIFVSIVLILMSISDVPGSFLVFIVHLLIAGKPSDFTMEQIIHGEKRSFRWFGKAVLFIMGLILFFTVINLITSMSSDDHNNYSTPTPPSISGSYSTPTPPAISGSYSGTATTSQGMVNIDLSVQEDASGAIKGVIRENCNFDFCGVTDFSGLVHPDNGIDFTTVLRNGITINLRGIVDRSSKTMQGTWNSSQESGNWSVRSS